MTGPSAVENASCLRRDDGEGNIRRRELGFAFAFAFGFAFAFAFGFGFGFGFSSWPLSLGIPV